MTGSGDRAQRDRNRAERPQPVRTDGERVDLDGTTFVRIGPEARRKVHAGPNGLRLLALGGAPGEAYKIVASTELDTAA